MKFISSLGEDRTLRLRSGVSLPHAAPLQRGAVTKVTASKKGQRQGRRFKGTLSDIDLRLLKVFVVLARCNGFAAAEVRLGKGKSAISADLTDLEQRLSVRLCQRGRSGFAITDEGRAVLEAAQTLFDGVDEFKDRVNTIAGRLSGELALYINYGAACTESPVAVALRSFARAHPSVFIQLISASSADIEQALLQGQADIAVTTLTREYAGLVSHPLFDETLRLYCGRSHPLFGTPDHALNLDIINKQQIIESNNTTVQKIAGWDRPDFTFAARTNGLEARAIAVLSGVFLGILPDKYAEPWVQAGQMRALCTDLISVTNTFCAVLPPTASSKLVARAFATALLES